MEVRVVEFPEGIIDIPNAFSPNSDNSNDELFVIGAGITEMNLKIFNRWGELVFETEDQTIGWDGTYKGEPQELDVYVYTLNAVLDTGDKVSKKGNITLLR
jgi:gliding motility-associated-like protein